MEQPTLKRGTVYFHKDGRKGVCVSSHPWDGALLVFWEIDREDDNASVYYDCERSDLDLAKTYVESKPVVWASKEEAERAGNAKPSA